MAFIKADIGPNKNIEGIIFAKTYYNCLDIIKEHQSFSVNLKKDDNGKKFIISKFIKEKQNYNIQQDNLLSVLI